ncbi:hypothetical protein F4604DRAFT_1921905 [Suillus subluteus]|nr:hypothetical protein F4604DRAFT_1921905 [Suillus subluteus]
MAQPEAHVIPTRSTPAHWRNEETTALVNHMYDNRASGDTSGNFKPQVYTSALTVINDDPNLQPLRIGPAKTIKMVKSKWTSLKAIHHAIDEYCNQTSTHWDGANGAGIHGPAASAVWDSYVALSSNIQMRPFRNAGWPYFERMQEIIPLGGARGCHAFHPGVMGPPPVPDADEDEPDIAQAPALSSAGPSSTSGPSTLANNPSIPSPSFTTSPRSITGGLSTATSSAGAKRPYEGTNFDSVETMSFASIHESAQPVSTTLVSAPPSKKARLHISQKMSNAAKMSSVTQAAKITPAAAVMGMQGTVNHLTDVFERFVVSSMNSGTMAGGMQLPPPPPPGPEPEGSMDLVTHTAHLLQTEDADMPPEQRAVLITVLGEKDNERFLKFYVSLTDKATRCPFIQKLITDAMVG